MSTQPTFPSVDPSALPAVDTLLDALVEQMRTHKDMEAKKKEEMMKEKLLRQSATLHIFPILFRA
jgi:hypothetical protein